MAAGSMAERVAGVDARAQTYIDPGPRRGVPWGTVALHAILLLCCVFILFPLAWVFLESLKSLPDSVQRYIWPRQFASPIYANYVVLWERRGILLHNFRNSLVVTGGTVVVATVVSILAGYALAHLRVPAAKVILGALVASTFFPTRVTALIGIIQMQDRLGLINRPSGLILPYSALGIAASVFIMRGVFKGVPRDIVDSARIDGASSFRALLGIMLPLIRNGMVVVAIVNFSFSWSEYVLAQTTTNEAANKTLPVFIASSSGGLGALSHAGVSALYVVGILPALVFFAGTQRWYMRGLQEGALKT